MAALSTRGHDLQGRPTYTARSPEPHTVYGGWRMAFTDWVRTEDGWDCDWDYEGLPETVFATETECVAAIEAEASRQAVIAKTAMTLNFASAA